MSEDTTMESTKKLIRSILNSNPCNMNSRTLVKDYYGLMGKPIPFKNLGYQSLDDFLHSIPDVVQVHGSGPNAVLTVVVNEKVKHISSMVTQQKLPPKMKRLAGFRRPAIPSPKRELPPRMRYPKREQLQNQQNYVASIPVENNKTETVISCSSCDSCSTCRNDNNNENLSKNDLGSLKSEPIKFTINKKQLPLPDKTFCQNNDLDTENNAFSMPDSKIQNLQDNDNVQYNCNQNFIAENIQNEDTSNQGAASAFTSHKTRQPSQKTNFYNSNDKHPKLYTLKKDPPPPVLSQQSLQFFTNSNDGVIIEKPPILYKFFESLDQYGSVTEQPPPVEDKLASKEPQVPDSVRNNLKKLIQKFPDGIWCRDLPNTYRKMFRRPLLYLEYGYRNLIDMVTALNLIFHCVQPESDDWLLFDCNQGLPEKYAHVAEENKIVNSKPEPINTILTNSNWNEFLWMFPDDIVPLGETIEQEFLREGIRENSIVEILVGEVYDPSKFWIYIKEPQLDSLMNEMQSFYNENYKKYLIPTHLLRNGLYCAQIIFGEYHRAVVVDATPHVKGEVRIYYIDYGTVLRVPAEGICFLSKKFSSLKGQAIRARLADICPKEEECSWSKETIDYFRSIVEGSKLLAKIHKLHNQDKIWEILLADASHTEIFYINDKLVEDGYAQFIGKALPARGQCTPNPALVKHLHYYPTFFEIENGLAPCAEEMKLIYNLDIPIHLYLPQYFNNYSPNEAKVMEYVERIHHKFKTKSQNEFIHDYDLEEFLGNNYKLELDVFGDIKEEIKEILKEDNEVEGWREDEFDEGEAEGENEIVTEWRRPSNENLIKINQKRIVDYDESTSDHAFEVPIQMNNVNPDQKMSEILENMLKLENDLLYLKITSEDNEESNFQINDIPQQNSTRKVENYLREQRKFLTNPFLNPNYDEDMKNLQNLPNPFLVDDEEEEEENKEEAPTEKSSFNVNAAPFEPKTSTPYVGKKVDSTQKWSDDLFGQEYHGNICLNEDMSISNGSFSVNDSENYHQENQAGASTSNNKNVSPPETFKNKWSDDLVGQKYSGNFACLNNVDLESISTGSFATLSTDFNKREVEIQTEDQDNKDDETKEPAMEVAKIEPSTSSHIVSSITTTDMPLPMMGTYPPPPPPWFNYNYNMNYNYWMQYQAAMQSMMMVQPPPPPAPHNMLMVPPPMMVPSMASNNFKRPPPGFPVKITNLDSPTGSK